LAKGLNIKITLAYVTRVKTTDLRIPAMIATIADICSCKTLSTDSAIST
jgi:hypothetical protein